MISAFVTNVQGYSIHDGPGIRTVVFLKGCPLRCMWCANPENLETTVQIGFFQNLCTGCGRCFKACTHGAILQGRIERINRTMCQHCADCVNVCYYDALVRYGIERDVGDVFNQVRRDKMFYESSGGGVTVSGGEPLMHAKFVEELFRLCHAEGINTCVETCGEVPTSAMETVLPVTDIFYYDLKIMNSEIHKKYTGVENSRILENARFLASHDANILFRQPVIPGINNTEENVYATANFIKSLGKNNLAIQLMPYHRMGLSKYEALSRHYELGELKTLPDEEVNLLEKLYCSLGVSCTVSR